MGRIINQHSYAAVALAVLAIAVFLTRHRSRFLRRTLLLALVALLGAWFVSNRTGSGDVHSAEDVDRAISGGLPVAVEFYSNY